MLWSDDDARRSLAEKVARAAEYFRNKYGEQPTVCYVHPSLLPSGGETAVAGLRLLPSKSVLVNHFWLGVNGEIGAGAKRQKAGVR
ncbi:MAG: hypothetical protein RMK99_01545 [Anaerolineales bacterium]|nr:hypothetical protein [Anaerolineales bacterium]